MWICHEVSNALREKPGFQALPKGLIVLLCAEVVRQGVPDHGADNARRLTMYSRCRGTTIICCVANLWRCLPTTSWLVCNSRQGTAEPCHADICAWWHQAYTLLDLPHWAGVSHHARSESGCGQTCDACLEVRGEIIRSVLCCIAYWSSPYSSLDRVLSHWASFAVHRFISVFFVCILCVFLWYCIVAVLLWACWGGPDGIEPWFLGPVFLQCYDTVGWIILPVKTRSQYDL